MPEQLGEAVLELRTDSTGLDSGLEDARQKAETLGATFVIAGAAITAIGTPFALATQSAIDAGDSLLAMSEKVGISVERLSAWKLGLELSNTSIDTLMMAMRALSQDVSGPLDQALLDLADRFAAMPDGQEKAALAIETFGSRIGLELIPWLNKGSDGIKAMEDDAASLGQVISKKTAIAADDLNDSIKRLTTSIQGIFNKFISTGIITKFTNLANKVADAVAEFTAAHPNFSEFVVIAGLMAAVIGPITIALGALVIAISAMSTPILLIFGAAGAIAGAIAALVAFTDENDKVRKAIEDIWKQIKSLFSAAFDIISGALKTFAGVLTGDWKLMADGIKQIWAGLWEAIKTIIIAPLKVVKDTIGGFTSSVTGFFSGMYDTIVGKSIVPDLMSGIEREFGTLDKIMKTPAQAATDSVLGAFNTMFGSLTSTISQKIPIVGNLVGDLINKALEPLKNALANMLEGLFGKIPGMPSGGGGGLPIPSGGGGGVGGAAGGLGGGLAGGLIGGALAGLGSFLGSMRLEGTMNAVEYNTRAAAIEIKDLIEQIMWPIFYNVQAIAASPAFEMMGTHLIPVIEANTVRVVSVLEEIRDAVREGGRVFLDSREISSSISDSAQFGGARLASSTVLR